MEFLFEVEHGKSWYQYDTPVQKQLMQCVSDGETQQELESPSRSVSVHLGDMSQEDTKSGEKTRIRCLATDDDGDVYTWTVTDSAGSTSYLGCAHIESLENAHTKKRVRCQNQPYAFDLKKMVAKVKGEADRTLERVAVKTKPYSARCKAVAGLAPAASAAAGNGTPAADNAPKKAPAKTGSKRKKGADDGAADSAAGDAPVMKSVILKTRAPVDSECPAAASHHVYCEGDDVWDCMLNQTNIGHNNNKYFLIQLLENDSGGTYCVWMRWGRVGFKGQNKMHNCGGNVGGAKNIFEAKFRDKTRNAWGDRDNFEKCAGKYDLLKMDYAEDEPDAKKIREEAKDKKKEIQPCKLPSQVQKFIELICNVKAMESAVMEMQYDTKKSPLGKLTEEQIRSGYEALKRIDELITNKCTGQELVEACSDFYTRIPHNFGMRPPALIRTANEVRQKLDLLEALGDIQLAMKLIGDEKDSSAHPADQQYHALDCDLRPLDSSDSTYKLVERYLSTTHGHTHSGYKLHLEEVFAVEKSGERGRFVDHGNRRLLWHGSRLTNWAGILGAGLKIAPPEAPATGYMFGKGIYFADMASKSANYCFSNRNNNQGILLLSEVSLGKCNELLTSNFRADLLPKGKHSTKGVGSCAPDPATAVTMEDGVVVPVGPGVPVSLKGGCLQYNEFIVYNVAQVRMRYVLRVRFDYKNW